MLLTLKSRQLGEVKVTSQQITTGGFNPGVTTGLFNSETVQYQTDKKGNYIGGVKIMLHDWNKSESKRINEERFLEKENAKAEISKVFSPEHLKKYLNIKGQEMQNFITLYIPDVKTYSSNHFDLLTYLNTCYQEFVKIPVKQRQSEDFLKLDK